MNLAGIGASSWCVWILAAVITGLLGSWHSGAAMALGLLLGAFAFAVGRSQRRIVLATITMSCLIIAFRLAFTLIFPGSTTQTGWGCPQSASALSPCLGTSPQRRCFKHSKEQRASSCSSSQAAPSQHSSPGPMGHLTPTVPRHRHHTHHSKFRTRPHTGPPHPQRPPHPPNSPPRPTQTTSCLSHRHPPQRVSHTRRCTLPCPPPTHTPTATKSNPPGLSLPHHRNHDDDQRPPALTHPHNSQCLPPDTHHNQHVAHRPQRHNRTAPTAHHLA